MIDFIIWSNKYNSFMFFFAFLTTHVGKIPMILTGFELYQLKLSIFSEDFGKLGLNVLAL